MTVSETRETRETHPPVVSGGASLQTTFGAFLRGDAPTLLRGFCMFADGGTSDHSCNVYVIRTSGLMQLLPGGICLQFVLLRTRASCPEHHIDIHFYTLPDLRALYPADMPVWMAGVNILPDTNAEIIAVPVS